MNVWKIVALGFIAATVMTVGYGVANAQAVQCNNQPNMAAAVGALQRARGWLERSEHNKGGWREKALEATDTALHETIAGCQFADTH